MTSRAFRPVVRLVLAITVLAAATQAPVQLASGTPRGGGTYTPCAFDGKVGQIHFENTSRYPVRVTLWHPDSRKPWGSYDFAGGEAAWLSDASSKINIGNDWGIQIGDSEVKCVGRVAQWQTRAFYVTTDRYNG